MLSLSNFSSLSPAYILPFLLSNLDPSSDHREEEEEEEVEDEEDEEDEEEADDESHPVTESSRQGAHRYLSPPPVMIVVFPHVVSPSLS